MKISKLETIPVNIPYTVVERSSIVERPGISECVVKLTTDDGLIGWGACTRCADAKGIVSGVEAMRPFLLGRDPFDHEAIIRDVFISGGWQFQPMTGNFAFAGIDMALWDLCGKATGQPLYKLLGGAVRDNVDYFYYLSWDEPEKVAAQCRDGVDKGYSCYYIKVGIDTEREEAILDAIRKTIGPLGKIRLDANQSWTVPEAIKLINRWDDRVGLDFVEAPVPIEPYDMMIEVNRRTSASLCANEGLWREVDALRLIQSRCADYLCFSSYWVGSLRRFMNLARVAELNGQLVCKHTHGELGLTAVAGQHAMLACSNATDGHQQTAQHMADDILTERLPIADGPSWGLIEGTGLGVEVDEEKLMGLHQDYLRDGELLVYGG